MPGTKMQIILVSIILIASLALLVTEKIAVDKTAMASWLPWHSPAFINNTPVVVLFIPIVMGLSCECDFFPSKLLIPLSYVSILAETCTLIGTSTNIIVSDLATTFGFEPLSMFELGIGYQTNLLVNGPGRYRFSD